MAAEPPEPPRDPEQIHRRLELILVHEPGHRGPQIVVLGLQPVQPSQLSAALQLGRCRLGQREEVSGVPVVRLPPAGALAQTLQRVLPDGLEQPEARLTAAGLRLYQAVVHQRAQRVYHLPGTVQIRPGDGVGLAADGLHGGAG